MNKLTKEQADELLANIACYCDSNTQEWERIFTLGKLREIIATCTKEDFPAFEMRHNGSWNTAIDLDRDLKEYINIKFWYCERNPSFYAYTREDFKSFVFNCRKIVEWLDNADK